jgi:hypothetical protein
MFKTNREKLQEIEGSYVKKDYEHVVVECARITEKAVGWMFRSFHMSLTDTERRLKFLEFEKAQGEKYLNFLKRPTIGVGIGFYNVLITYFPGHDWLNAELKTALNTINIHRNAQVHSGKAVIKDHEAGEVLDATESFLKGINLIDKPEDDLGFSLKHFLVFRSIESKFEIGESDEDFKRIINDSNKLMPELLSSVFHKVYPFLPVEDKEKVNRLYPDVGSAGTKKFSLKNYIEVFEEVHLFEQMNEGESLHHSLKAIADEYKGSYTKRAARHHVNILDIIFRYIRNEKLDHLLEYADLVKKKYLEDSKINQTDRIILNDRAKDLRIPGNVAETIEKTVVRTIENELILFQTLHEDRSADEAEAESRARKKTLFPVQRILQNRVVVLGTAAAILILFAAIYFIWIRSEYPAYERVFLQGKPFVEKCRKARTLKDVRAHALYIWGTYSEHYYMPDELIDEYRKFFKEHPESPEAHYYLAEVYYFAHQSRSDEYKTLDSTWILLNEALEMGLKAYDADLMKMDIYFDLGLIPQFIESADQLVRDYPENPDAWLLAGMFYRNILYDTLKAVEYYHKAIEIYPKTLNGYQYLADLYIASREFDQAFAMLQEAVKINPDNRAVASSYRLLFLVSNRFNEATEFIEGMMKKYRLKNVEYYRILANLYVQNNDTSKARSFIESSLKKYPGDSGLQATLEDLDRMIKMEAEESDRDEGQKIKWLKDIDEALALARKEGKPILAEFYDQPSNYQLLRMKENVYRDSTIQALLEKYVPVRLFETRDFNIFKEYGIDYAYYNIFIISPDGVKLENDYYYYYQESEKDAFARYIRTGLNIYSDYQLGRKLNTETFTEVSNLDDARNFSRIKGFPIMMVVTSENSIYSKRLLEETLNDPIFKAEFNNIIYLHVTAEKNKDIISNRNIRIFPSILFLGQDGEVIHETRGNMIPKELARILRKVKEVYSKGTAYENEINWFYSLQEARTAALLEQKYIFMGSAYFRSSYTEEYSSNKDVLERLDDFICFSFALEDRHDKDLITRFGSIYWQTCLILDPSGNALFKTLSLPFWEQEEILNWMDIEKKMEKLSLMGYEKYEHYKNQVDLAEAMVDRMPRSSVGVYETILEEFPDDLEIIHKITSLYLDYLEEAEEGLKYLQLEVEKSPDCSDDQVDKLIATALQSGQIDAFRQWLDGQIELNATDNSKKASLYACHSELSEILMDPVSAKEYALKAVQSDPEDIRSNTQMGRLLYYSGDLNGAKKYFTKVSRDHTKPIEANFYLALIAQDRNDMVEKERIRQNGLIMAPHQSGYESNPKFYNYPGYIHLIKQYYKDYLKLTGSNSWNKDKYALFITDFGNDLQLALQLINECVEEAPDQIDFILGKAWILYRMGQYAEADKCIPQDQEQYEYLSYEYLYYSGKIKLAVGDTVQGMEYLKNTQSWWHNEPRCDFMKEDIEAILKEAG